MRAMVLALVAAGCAVSDRAEVDEGAGSPVGLGATLNVRVESDTVRLTLHVTNVTETAVRLEFGTAQRYDFEVTEMDGGVVWQWSAERMFAQVEGVEVLQPGESVMYEERWLAPAGSGEYVATGRLTSRNNPVELRTAFDASAG